MPPSNFMSAASCAVRNIKNGDANGRALKLGALARRVERGKRWRPEFVEPNGWERMPIRDNGQTIASDVDISEASFQRSPRDDTHIRRNVSLPWGGSQGSDSRD